MRTRKTLGGGLSIGEAADAHAVVSYVLESDSFAVTGGQFGIEASVISLAGYCIVPRSHMRSCAQTTQSAANRNRITNGGLSEMGSPLLCLF